MEKDRGTRPHRRSRRRPVLRVRRIEIVDTQGRVRVEIGAYATGAAQVIVRDEAGVRRLYLGVVHGQPGLELVDQHGISRLIAELDVDGRPRLEVVDPDGRRITDLLDAYREIGRDANAHHALRLLRRLLALIETR